MFWRDADIFHDANQAFTLPKDTEAKINKVN